MRVKRAKNGPKWQKILCCIPYLRKHTSYDCDFWYTCVKWWHFQMLFSFFLNFDFLIVRGVKCKKWPKMRKNSICLTPYLRNCTSYDCGSWYTCIKWWYLQQFFHFFKILIFWVFRGEGNRAKTTHNYQFQSVTLYISKNCRSYHEDCWYTGIK